MAISPTDFMDVFNAALAEFENIIDERLEMVKMLQYETEVTIEAPPNMKSPHFRRLKDKYLAMGWHDVTLFEHFKKPRMTFKIV